MKRHLKTDKDQTICIWYPFFLFPLGKQSHTLETEFIADIEYTWDDEDKPIGEGNYSVQGEMKNIRSN